MKGTKSAHSRYVAAVILALALVTCSCGGGPASPSAPSPDADSVATTVARSVAATLDAAAGATEAAPALQPTEPSTPVAPTATEATAATDTAVPTATPLPSDTPTAAGPTETPSPSPSPRPTHSPMPTTTPTSQPRVGSVVYCDSDWTIRVLEPPSFAKQLNVLDTGGYLTFSTQEAAKGTWLMLLFELTNLQDSTDDIYSYDDTLLVKAKLGDAEVSFSPSSWGTSRADRAAGISDWTDDVPPGITVTALAIFDVNPAASSWSLVLETGGCSAEVLLIGDEVSSGGPVVVIGRSPVNLRGGPGTGYPVVGQGQAMQRLSVVGRNADASWWQVCCVQGEKAWVAASVVTADGDVTDIAVAEDIPAPPATATPLPRTRPSGEFTVSTWGLRLYDVKKTKTVYFFGSGDSALGVWLIPFLEVRNLGTGTAQPHYNLDFYLQDGAGRTWEFDPFNDAVLGAAWQYQAGHLYDDIGPGLVLGVALPFDVPADLGDVWLLVEQDRNFAMYLGSVSQLPQA